MAAKKAVKKATKKPTKAATEREKGSKGGGFTDDERAAMRERVKELKASGGKEDDEKAVREKIAAMAPPDRALGERIHALIKTNAPDLSPRLWYGMPAYAKDGSVVCHFQDARKFKTRYATIGFSDKANLDDGHVWPVAFALKGGELTATDEARIVGLLKKAVGG